MLVKINNYFKIIDQISLHNIVLLHSYVVQKYGIPYYIIIDIFIPKYLNHIY